MKRRVFIGLGAASIGAGALYRTGAFSSVSAGRGVAVNAVEAEKGALLGIKNRDDEDIDPVFENNTSLNMRVDLPETAFDPAKLAIPDGEEKSAKIGSGEDISDVSITATLFDGGSAGDYFEDGTQKGRITLQRDFSRKVAFGINGTITAEAPQGGQIEFEIGTDGDLLATVTGFDVKITGNLAEDVRWNNSDSEIPDTFDDPETVLLDRFTRVGRGNSPADLIIDDTDFAEPPSEGDIIVTFNLEFENRDDTNVDIGIKASVD